MGSIELKDEFEMAKCQQCEHEVQSLAFGS